MYFLHSENEKKDRAKVKICS